MATEVNKSTRVKPADLVANARSTEAFWQNIAKWIVLGGIPLAFVVAIWGWAGAPPSQPSQATAPVQTAAIERQWREPPPEFRLDALNCNGKHQPLTFSPKWEQFNPAGQCSHDLFYTEREVTLWVKLANTHKVVGPFKRGDKFPDGAEWIRSEGKTFAGSVVLVPPRNKSYRSANRGAVGDIWAATFGSPP